MKINSHTLILITSTINSITTLSFVFMVIYALTNLSAHTGLDPYLTFYIFIPLSAFGLIIVVFHNKLKIPFFTGVLSLLICVANMSLIIYLDHTNKLVYYEDWIIRGMP